MRLLALALVVISTVARAAITAPAEPTPFTARELAQGYRDTLVLARPMAGARGAVEVEEARQGVRVRRTFPAMGDLRVIEIDPAESAAEAIERLRATGRYEFVERDYIVSTAVQPDESSFHAGQLWPLNNTGTQNGIAGADIDAVAAWDIIREAPEVVVAVIDTGINLQHADLVPNLWVNPAPTFNDIHGARFISGLSSGNPTDDNGHGTHIAGTIGAVGNNGIGITGIAWRVKLMAVKAFDSSGRGAMSDIVMAINYAIGHGAHIINGSYGLDGGTLFSQAQLTALTAARNAGIIFVAAAGNASANLDVTRAYPASHALDNIVSVGNSTRRDELAFSSNYGAAVDLFAPGSEIVSLSHVGTNGTATLSGTSMAAPHVTGALALLKARFPGETHRELINRLLRGVDRAERFVGKAQTGGRLNLLNALNTAGDPNGNRPFNDNFASRPRLLGSNLAVRSHNGGATSESGEPVHGGLGGGTSLWWEWVAPLDGTVSVNTTGSDYDTILAVYSGNNLAGLTPVASNDDAVGSLTSRLAFTAQAGVSYQIAIEGKPGATGLTRLTLGTTPGNDAFSSATLISGNSVHVTTDNPNSSREPGEPIIQGWPGGLSLWYRWVAPHAGRFQISATSSDFDPLLGVFTGSSVDSLTVISTDAGTSQTGSLCAITAVAGTTYYFVVDARSAGDIGQFTLTLSDALWQSETTNSITSAAALGRDGTVYVGSTDNSVYAFRPDGSKKWSFTTNGSIDVSSPAVAGDGTVYVAAGYTGSGALYALRPEDGSVRWTHSFSAGVPAANSPSIATDGTIYIKPSDGFLYALDPANGAQKWRFNVNGELSYSSAAIAPDGTIYVGSEDGKLYAINPNGTLKWTFQSSDEIYTTPSLDAAGNIYFSVLNTGHLYSVTPAGTQRWVYTNVSLGSSSSAAISGDGTTAYFAGYDSKLHAVDTATGARRWAYTLGDEVRASSPAVDANGVVYVGCYDFKLYAVNFDGTLKRTWSTGNWIRSSPTIDGTTLYVGSNDHRLYAFDIGAGPANGPWPQYRQNARRLGRAFVAPSFTQQPASQSAGAGQLVVLNAAIAGEASTVQWQRNGRDIPGATGVELSLFNIQPTSAGIYTAVATQGSTVVRSAPAIVGVNSTIKVMGGAHEFAPNIVHLNGNIYDQILLDGPAATITADPGQIVRMSYVDLHDDIVQVEFAGAGALSVNLEGFSGPATPVNYNQDVPYMRGHASIVITGADSTTHVSVFSVGKITALNQSLFKDTVDYEGMADIASLAILSATGEFGSIRMGNTSFLDTKGVAGLYAPGVQVKGAVVIGDISSADAATPMLLFGGAPEVKITGGDLFQPNARAIQVGGFSQLLFTDGTNSHGRLLPAQDNKGRLERDGADVTSTVVVDPSP